MLFSYKWLESFFDKDLPKPKKLAELIILHSFEVDEVKEKDNDYILDIDITPNRGSDCLSHLGMAKEIAAILDIELKKKKQKFKENKKRKAKDIVKLEVKNKKDCLRYTARVIENVEVQPSPKKIQDRLKLLGLQPINNIVDILNYVMLETGQPLHAFDADKVEKKKIAVRRAKNKEKINTLDDKEYELDQDVLVISDPKDALAIAGIKGGKKAEIGNSTKTIIIESANFNNSLIRKASKKIDLKTDASWIFEHGIDPNLTEEAINRASYLIQKIADGKIASGLVDFYPQERLPRIIGLKTKKVQSLLGIDISQKKIIEILKRGSFEIKDKMKGAIKVKVPTFRLDIKIPEDLIEEIGRLYGYQKIPKEFPSGDLSFPKRNVAVFWKDKIQDILKELSFTEIYNTSFINPKEAAVFDYNEKELIATKNPISAEYQYLRPSLIPKLLKNVKDNCKDFDSIQIFEIGKIFQKDEEQRAVAGLIAKKKDKEVFYRLKGIIDVLLEKLGISEYYYDSYEATPEESKSSVWNPKKSAEIRIDNKEIGFIGYISNKVLDELNLNREVVLFDIDFEILKKLATEEREYQPVSPYPAAVRDLSIVLPREVKVVEVMNIINITGKELIKDVDLFDVYEEFSKDKKSLAFHIIYQSQEKTLSSKEINQLHNKIVEKLESNKNWKVRK